MNIETLVSIVVPVYNCGDGLTLNKLVKSILTQSYRSWELILCNDGSTDQTLDICKELSSLDSRIRYIDCPHKGVSSTRNTGIENSRGEWVTFVDSDDKLTPTFIESLITPIKTDSSLDLVCCSYYIVETSGCSANLYQDRIYKGDEEIRYLLGETSFLKRCSPWARLFKKEILIGRSIFFNTKLEHSEDRLFLYRYLVNIKSIATVSNPGYIYGSFSSNSLKHKRHQIETYKLRQTEITKAGKELIAKFNLTHAESTNIYINLLNLIYDAINNISLSGKSNNEIVKIEKDFLNIYLTDNLKKILKDNRNVNNFVKDNYDLNIILNYSLCRFNIRSKFNLIFLKVKQLVKGILIQNKKEIKFENYIKYLN